MKTICIFGDSITWGAFDFEFGGWVEHLKRYLFEKDKESEIYNLGISGDSTEDLLARFKEECKSHEPTTIIIAIGINDTQSIDIKENPLVNLENFKKNIDELLKQAKNFTDKIVFVGLTNVAESKIMPKTLGIIRYFINEKISLYDSEIKKFCKKNNLLFVDVFGLLKDSDLPDGLHPNSKGHEKMFNAIKNSLIKNKII